MPIAFQLKLDANGVRKGAKEAESCLKDLTGKIGETAKSAIDLKNVLAGIGTGLSLSKVIQDFSAFQSAVDNIGKVTDASLANVASNIKKLDASLGSSTQLAQGYYQVMSAGITNAAKAQDMLIVASQVAKTAGISQAEAINALAKVMNGYGSEMKDAATAANMFFTVEKLGMTNVAELAPVMGDLAGIAKNLNVEYTDLAGAMALITQTTGSTATSATNLRAMMLELMRPSEALKGIFKGLGVSSAETLIEMRGLPDALKAINEQAEATGKSMATVFGGQEAYQGFIKLMDDQFGKLKAYSGEVESTTDALSKAWGRYTQSINGQFDEVANRALNLSTTIGESLGEPTLAGLKGLNSGLNFLDKNFETVEAGALALGAGISALTIFRKLDVEESFRQFLADTQLHGVQNTLADRIAGVDSAQRKRISTQKVLLDDTVKSARIAVEEAKSLQQVAIAAENNAKTKYEQSVAAKEGAITSRQVQNALAKEAATLSTLHAAQTKTFSATNTLNAAQRTLAATTTMATASLTNMSVAQTAMAGLRAAGSGLLSMLGGPWGAAFTAAAVGVTYLATKEDEGAKFAREHAEAMSLAKDNAGDAASSMKTYADSIQSMTEAQLAFEQAVKQSQIDKVLGSGGNNYSRIFTDFSSFIPTKEEIDRLMQFNKILPSNFSKTTSEELRELIEEMRRLGVETKKIEESKKYIENLLKPLLALKLQQEELSKTSSGAANAITGMGAAAAAAYSPLSSLKDILDAINKTEIAPATNAGSAVEQLQKDLQGTKAIQEQMQAATKARTAENLTLLRQQVELARVEQQARERLAAANNGGDFAERAKKGAAELAKAETQLNTFTAAAGQLGKETGKSFNSAESSAKSLTSELARLQLTDAQYQQWQTAQKIADLEKTLGKANPKVKELQALLQNDLEAKFLQSIQEYADPATAQLAKLQKEYQKVLDTVNGSKSLSESQKALFNTQAARQYEKALAGVAGTTQNLAKFTKETAHIEAELSGNRDTYWEKRREQLLEELGYYSQHADKAAILAATEARIRVERLQKESENSQTFAKLWEETYKRVDESMSDWLYNMFTGAEAGFKGLKNAFLRMLAEMANAALLRPITVQIMGVMGGVMGGLFGGSGTANAAGQMLTGSGTGNMGLGNLTSFMPNNLFSGITDTINSTMAGWFPGTFAASSEAALGNAGVGLLKSQLGGGSFGPTSTFLGSVGPALGAGALGGMGYSLLGGMLGLPQGKYSGITSSLGGAAGWGLGSLVSGSLAGGGALAGAAAGSVIPVIGTILGALGGGLLGSLFGSERKTKPSVYTQGVNMPISSQFDYTSHFMGNAWYDRAGTEEAGKVMPILGEAAKVSAQQIEALVAALPEEFRGEVEKEIQSAMFDAGPATPGMDKHNWNFQFYDEEQLKQRLEQVVKDIQLGMGRVAQEAMAEVDLTSMYNFDLGTSEGMDRAVKAVTSVKEITEATKAIAEPSSQLVAQAKAAKDQMDQWTKSMQEYGVVGEYANKVVDEYRQASIKANVDALEEALNPLSAYEQAVKAANTSVNDTIEALKVLGAAEEEVARVEGLRAKVIESMTGAMVLAFEQDMRLREAQLSGDAERISSVQLAIQHERELADVRAKFGEESRQYAQIVNIQMQEMAQLAANAAKEFAAAKAQFQSDYSIRTAEAGGQDTTLARLAAQQESEIQQIISKFGAGSKEYFDMLTLHGLEYSKAMQQAAQNSAAAAESAKKAWDAATEEVRRAEQAILQYTYDMVDQLAQKMRDVLKAYVDQATNIYDKAQSEFAQGLKRDMDKLSGSIDGFNRAVADMRGVQKDIWRQNATPAQSYTSLSAEMQQAYAKAAGGDVDAASEFSGLVSRWLDASYQSQTDFSGYDKDRIDADKMLEDLSGIFDGQKSEAQKQLDALQSIYDALVEPEKSLDKLLIELIAARATLDKTLNQQGDYYGKWNLGELHGELGQIDFSTIKGSASISEYIQKGGKDTIAHLLGLSGDLSQLEDSTVKNLLDMIGGIDNVDEETKKQTGVFEEKLAENIHELYSSLNSLQALELELSKANQEKMDAIGKYGPLQINNKLDELKNALVAAIKNQGSITPPSGGGGTGGGTTTPTKPTGSLSQSQILSYYRPDVAAALASGEIYSFSSWYELHGKAELGASGVTWKDYEGSGRNSDNYLGSMFATESLLLKEAATRANNAYMLQRRDWTPASIKAHFLKNYASMQDWYNRSGQYNSATLGAFEAGGVTVPGMAFEANEGGRREIFMSPVAQGVLSADDSKRTMDAVISMGKLMNMPAAPADSQAALLREIRAMREENAGMRQELKALREHIRHIDDSTRKANDRLAKWDNDGLPKETVQ